jgi:hypothetical protein
MKILVNGFIAVLLLILISGCASSPTGSYTSRATNIELPRSIGEITEKNMKYEGIKRNPLIVIHGFQGANLENSKTGENLWGEFKSSDVLLGNADKLRQVSHPMEKGKKIDELCDDIVPNGILKKVKIRFMGITVEAIAYDNLIQTLVFGGYQPESLPLGRGKHFNSLFEFAYDWRRDLPYNAKVLDKYIKEKTKYIQNQYERLYGIKDFDVQFDIIAHSMGGLLSRYYLRYGGANLPEDGSIPEITWAGSKHLDTVIIAGTPNAGYLDTFLEMLSGGKTLNIPPAALGTLPTYYQMLPAPSTESILFAGSNNPVDVFNPKLWEEMHWGLMDPAEDSTLQILLPEIKTKEERKSIAFDHLAKCLKRAKQFIMIMKVKASPPDDVKLKLIFGHAIKTSRRVYMDKKTGKIRSIEYSYGDGKVLSTSALYDARAGGKWTVFFRSPIAWSDITILRAAHMGILESPVFQDNVLFHLMMTETEKQEKILQPITED